MYNDLLFKQYPTTSHLSLLASYTLHPVLCLFLILSTFPFGSDLEEKRTASQPSLCDESKLCSDHMDYNGSSAITTELNMDESLVSQYSRPSEAPDPLQGLPDSSPLNPITLQPPTNNGLPNSAAILD